MVANPVGEGRGFGTDDNEIHILHPSGKVRSMPRLSKREISRAIFDEIEGVLEKKRR
jgi:phosphopantothenoylcysteine synthetase/decarboxylase